MNKGKKFFVGAAGLALLLALAFAALLLAVALGASPTADTRGTKHPVVSLAGDVELPTVVVYKTRQCGCCQIWADHMVEAGFKVKVKNVNNLRGTKSKYGIPPHLETCHTAVVGEYVVEGHVPAEAVMRMLNEQPDIAGIVVPGMPVGSPGMEQGLPENYDRYRVLTLGHDGSTAVYERH